MSKRNLGVLCGLMSALSFSSSNLMIRVGASHIPSAQIMAGRCILAFLFLTPFIYPEIPLLKKRKSLPLWLRFIGGSCALLALFANIRITGLAGATALNNLSSLVVVTGSALLFKEKLSSREWIGVLWVILGAAILQSPWGLQIPALGLIIGIAGACSSGIGLLALKKSASRASARFTVWGFCLACGLLSIFLSGSGLSREPWHWNEPTQLGFLIALCSIGIIGQLLLAKAYALLPASIASTISLSGLVWSITMECIYTQKWPSPGSILAYVLILCGLTLLQKVARK